MHNGNLLRLLQLSDTALPIGGFAHSYGLETYVQQGIVYNSATAKDYITAMLAQNLRYTDGAVVSLSYDAAMQRDVESLIQLDDECTAVKLPQEIRQASQKMGMRLVKLFGPLCNDDFFTAYQKRIKDGIAIGHYCIVFGLLAHLLKIGKDEALTSFYYNAAAGMVTNSVKLIPLGQMDGQALLFSLQPLIHELVTASLVPDRELIGLCCTGFDLRCMQHEQLYSRLYMS